MGAGHGGASGRYDALRETAFTYSFVLWQMGLASSSFSAPSPHPAEDLQSPQRAAETPPAASFQLRSEGCGSRAIRSWRRIRPVPQKTCFLVFARSSGQLWKLASCLYRGSSTVSIT